MLISTSRKSTQCTRILCRELARVLPDAKYVPRGTKTINKIASLAASLGYNRVMVVSNLGGGPIELRFLDVGNGWRWLDAWVELGEVKLQRDLGQKIKLEKVKVYAEEQKARNLANFLGELLGLTVSSELPNTGAVVLITSNNQLRLQLQLRPSPEVIGPVLQIMSFGRSRGKDETS